MKAKLTLIAAAMAVSGLVYAAGEETGQTGQMGQTDQMGQMGGEAGAVPSFTQIDANGDGMIDYNEAQADPTLSKYWQDQNLPQDHTMDQSEFAQFEESMGVQPSEQPPTEGQQPSPGMSQ